MDFVIPTAIIVGGAMKNFDLLETKSTRRKFLQSASLFVAGGTLVGCSSDDSSGLVLNGALAREDYTPPMPDETNAKWIYPYCTMGCGGPCLNGILVKDGVILRHGTDTNNPDDPNYLQFRTCVKGRSLAKGYYGADRLRYPMKRKSWTPGNPNGQLRGKDEWERITWDQAYDYIKTELLRLVNTYGANSIATPRSRSNSLNALATKLGIPAPFAPNAFTSEGTQPMVMQCILGEKNIHTNNSDRMQFYKTKLLVLFGFNPAWSCNHQINQSMQKAKESGAKIIVIDPMYTHSSAALADQWIPIRPGTDSAFLTAVAHYMYTNNLHNQAFLDKYTVGFDSAHMPADAPAGAESYVDYLTGTRDGIVKDAAWATKICGVPVDVIERFAAEVATTSPAIWQASTSPCRTADGEQFPHAFFTVSWMTGNVGKEGAGTFHNYGRLYASSSKYPIGTARASRNVKAAGAKPCHHEEFYDAILTGEYTSGYDSATQTPIKTNCNIKGIWSVAGSAKGCFINQFRGVHNGLKAIRTLEFIVANDIFMTPVAQIADIILPDTSHWERGNQFHTSYKPDSMFYSEKVSEAFFEARNGAIVDYDLSVLFDAPIAKPDMQASFVNALYNTKITDTDGVQRPLVTFTQADLDSFGTYGEGKTPRHGLVTLEELRNRGMYTPPRKSGDAYDYIAYKDYIDDPVANPLDTPSGKMEIYSVTLAKTVESFAFNKKDPLPKYMPMQLGYESTFVNNDINDAKGPYPFQLFNFRRVNSGHTTMYSVKNLRNVMPHNIYIHTDDAAAKGIAQNDIVLVSTEHGKMIIRAYVSERIVPGVVALGEGAWFDFREENGELIDINGSVNVLSANLPNTTNVPYSNRVQIEKYTGSLTPEMWTQIVPVKEEGAK